MFITQITPGLPKTRSGKMMRWILRKVAENKHDELGDVSTLADPPVVATIVSKHHKNMEGNGVIVLCFYMIVYTTTAPGTVLGRLSQEKTLMDEAI